MEGYRHLFVFSHVKHNRNNQNGSNKDHKEEESYRMNLNIFFNFSDGNAPDGFSVTAISTDRESSNCSLSRDPIRRLRGHG